MFFLLSLGYFFTLLCSGWVAARVTHRIIIILSSVMIGLTLIGTALAGSLWAVRTALLLLGIATGLYLPSGIATLTSLVESRHWGKALSVHELAPNLGFVIAPLISEAILLHFSWRAVPVLMGMAAFFLAAGFSRFGRGGLFTGVRPSIRSFAAFFSKPAFWIMMVLFGMGISSTLGLYTMLPLYLVTEHSLDRSLANTLVAFSRISTIFIALLGGWASDRFGYRKTMIVVFLTTGIMTIGLGGASTAAVLVLVFVQPMTAVCFFPAGFVALSRIGPPETRNIAVSLTLPAAFLIGGGAVPTVIGFMGDAVSFGQGIMLVGGFILGGAGLAYFLQGPSTEAR